MKFEDFLEGDPSVRVAKEFLARVKTCPLGDKCNHVTDAECDEYRLKLNEEGA